MENQTVQTDVMQKYPKLSQREKISYGYGAISISLIWTITTSWSMFYFTNVFGITAAAAGTLLFIMRIWDGAIDPVIGTLVDRTKSRFGKARPYLLWFAVPYGVVGAMLFYTPNISDSAKLVYAYVFYFLLVTVYSFIAIPYQTLNTLLSKDQKERSALTRNSLLMGMTGYIVTALIPVFAAILGSGATELQIQRTGFFRTTLIFGAIAIACWLLTFFNVKERITEINAKTEKVFSLWQQLKSLVKNPPWMIYMSSQVFSQIRISFLTVVLPYYCKYVLGQEDSFASIALIITLVGMLAGLFLGHIALDPLGIRGAMISAYSISLLGSVVILLFGHNIVLLLISLALIGICLGVTACVGGPATGDVIEYGEWKTGVRAEGLTFAMFSFIQQAAIGLGSFLLGRILTTFGFNAELATQNPSTVRGIEAIFTWGPIICSVAIIVIISFYKLNKTKYNQIVRELEERRGAAASAEE